MLSIVQEEPTIYEEEKEQRNPNLNRDLFRLLTNCSHKCSFTKAEKKHIEFEIGKYSIFNTNTEDQISVSKAQKHKITMKNQREREVRIKDRSMIKLIPIELNKVPLLNNKPRALSPI